MELLAGEFVVRVGEVGGVVVEVVFSSVFYPDSLVMGLVLGV